MITQFDFTTEDKDYTYKYLPTDPKKDALIKDILNEAVKYNDIHWVRISNEYYEYLSKTLNFTEPDEDNNILFYYDLSEGYLTIRKTRKFIDLLFFLNTEDDNINQTVFNKIKRSASIFHKQGLNTFLDPNHGGDITKESLEIASLIIFG